MTDSRPRAGCRARSQGDQYYCPRCGLLWDKDDPEPPACREEHEKRPEPAPVEAE